MTKEQSGKEKFFKTVANLEEILKEEKNDINRDSAIKRFELAFDVSWKFLKILLENEKGLLCYSPNDCFKQAYIQGYIKYDDLWIKMTKERNESVHTYKDELAEALYKKLPEYLKLFEDLKKNIE